MTARVCAVSIVLLVACGGGGGDVPGVSPSADGGSPTSNPTIDSGAPVDASVDAPANADASVVEEAGVDAGADADADAPPPLDCVDMDGDGFGIGPDCVKIDCDDANPLVNPDRQEIADDGSTSERFTLSARVGREP